MNENKIREAIEVLKSTTLTCCNGNSCINLILVVRRFFFSLPGKEQNILIDISEEDHGILFNNSACATAMLKCPHSCDFDRMTDEPFCYGLPAKIQQELEERNIR